MYIRIKFGSRKSTESTVGIGWVGISSSYHLFTTTKFYTEFEVPVILRVLVISGSDPAFLSWSWVRIRSAHQLFYHYNYLPAIQTIHLKIFINFLSVMFIKLGNWHFEEPKKLSARQEPL